MSDFTPQTDIDLNSLHRLSILKSLLTAARQATAESDPDRLLIEICQIAIKFLNATTGSLFIWDPETNRLFSKAVVQRPGESLESQSMPSDQGIAGWVFTHRKPLIVNDVRLDTRRCELVDECLGLPCASMIAAPLIIEQEVFGVIEILNKRSEEPFTEFDLDILTTLADQASIAIDNMRMSVQLKRQRQQLITIEQEIYKKLARDLHDGPTQWLAGISMNLEFVLRLLDFDLSKARIELEDVRHEVGRIISQLRNMMFELRPIFLESHDLSTALIHYVGNLNESENMNVKLGLDGLKVKIEPRAERAIFEIIREALSNIRRHAATPDVWINFQTDKQDVLTVTIADNGLGFNVAAVQQNYASRGSLGMLNMVERGELLGGKLSITSVPNKGTAVTLTVPLSNIVAR